MRTLMAAALILVYDEKRHYWYVYTLATPSVKYPVPKVPPLKPDSLALWPGMNRKLTTPAP